MVALSVNLNKIALIRNSRETDEPDVVAHALHCIEAGADGITVHPRPDQRHIRASDCPALKSALASIELNIEGNPFAGPQASNLPFVSDYPGFMPIVRQVRPAQCTLVPDDSSQLTSDHGFDLHQAADDLAPVVDELKSLGCRVSLFMDANPEQIRLAAALGVDRIELYTGPYAEAWPTYRKDDVLRQYVEASEVAQECGLGLNAGHDLDLRNLADFASAVVDLREVSIGHHLTIAAIEMGLANAVKAYLRCLGRFK